MSQADQSAPDVAGETSDLDEGVRLTFGQQPPPLPGWTCQATAGVLHSYHVTARDPGAAGQDFGLITDAADGLIEAVALLGTLAPTVTSEMVLRLLNELHQEVSVGRFILTDDPMRLLFEAELVLGAGDNRQHLVVRLLPVLLRMMLATMREEQPRLAAVLAGEP
jgi:hypothetical protein